MEATQIARTETPGQAIDRLCREHGRAKWWLANQLSISQSYLSRLIGDQKPVTPGMARRLADVFGEAPETFLPREAE